MRTKYRAEWVRWSPKCAAGSFGGGRAAAGAVGFVCRARRLRPLVFGLVSAAAVAGCATAIVPPERVADPVPVALLDHGRHTSLLVGTPDRAMIRYAYGDWTWYALGRTGVAEASVAVLGPSKAALGRKRHPGPLTPEAVQRQIKVPIEVAFYFDVEADAAEALVDRLDAVFQANIASMVVNRAYDLEFVPHPAPYSLSRNSNTMVASWLREMGTEVEGPALLANWVCPERGAEQRCRRRAGGAASASFALSWVEAKGTGQIRAPVDPRLPSPDVAVLAELDEGPRVLSNREGDRAAIGDRAVLRWRERDLSPSSRARDG